MNGGLWANERGGVGRILNSGGNSRGNAVAVVAAVVVVVVAVVAGGDRGEECLPLTRRVTRSFWPVERGDDDEGEVGVSAAATR